jgi:hypothetical protein
MYSYEVQYCTYRTYGGDWIKVPVAYRLLVGTSTGTATGSTSTILTVSSTIKVRTILCTYLGEKKSSESVNFKFQSFAGLSIGYTPADLAWPDLETCAEIGMTIAWNTMEFNFLCKEKPFIPAAV